MDGSVRVGAEFKISSSSLEYVPSVSPSENKVGPIIKINNEIGFGDVQEVVRRRNVNPLLSSHAVTEPADDDAISGGTEAYMASVLCAYESSMIENSKHHIGYPFNLDIDFGALAKMQHICINNFGDPFIRSNYAVHSRQFQVGVLDWFARLWEIETHEYWGYVSNGGTEGNLYGILVGREAFPDGVLYASKDSHYSVFKAARMYRMKCTTMKGAIDDLDLVIDTLKGNGFAEDRFYTHCDAALFGLMLPFVTCTSKLSFKKPIGSVSVSGHKFIGCPTPCGVTITRLDHINALSRNIEYIATLDATIAGSRNGHALIFLWYALNRKGYRGLQKEVRTCLSNAQYLKDRLSAEGIGAMLNENSNIVVFERPQNEDFVLWWQIACQGTIAHVVMPNITTRILDDFLEDYIDKRSSWFQEGKLQPPCIAVDIGEESCCCPQHK
ncbi:hypothetical protein MKX03_004210 [Papaver bracteatum]|nr:hypothetical protein MKX03_004210 [Papaver bracteatum]